MLHIFKKGKGVNCVKINSNFDQLKGKINEVLDSLYHYEEDKLNTDFDNLTTMGLGNLINIVDGRFGNDLFNQKVLNVAVAIDGSNATFENLNNTAIENLSRASIPDYNAGYVEDMTGRTTFTAPLNGIYNILWDTEWTATGSTGNATINWYINNDLFSSVTVGVGMNSHLSYGSPICMGSSADPNLPIMGRWSSGIVYVSGYIQNLPIVSLALKKGDVITFQKVSQTTTVSLKLIRGYVKYCPYK